MATYLTSCTATSGECWQGANTYLTISNTATTDTSVLISSADPAIVAAPVSVTIPANSHAANFTVAGLAAGTTQLTATLGTSTAHIILTVLPTAALSTVTLLSPADRSTLSSLVKFVILRWRAMIGATSYAIKVHDDTIDADNSIQLCSGFAACALDTTSTVTVTISNTATTDTSVLISSADPAIVAAPVSVTIPANSHTANFTVAGLVAGTTQLTATLGTSTAHIILTVLPTAALSPVTLLSPADRSTLSSLVKFVILRWRAVVGANSYAVKVHDDTIPADNADLTCVGYAACALTTTTTSYSFRR